MSQAKCADFDIIIDYFFNYIIQIDVFQTVNCLFDIPVDRFYTSQSVSDRRGQPPTRTGVWISYFTIVDMPCWYSVLLLYYQISNAGWILVEIYYIIYSSVNFHTYRLSCCGYPCFFSLPLLTCLPYYFVEPRIWHYYSMIVNNESWRFHVKLYRFMILNWLAILILVLTEWFDIIAET